MIGHLTFSRSSRKFVQMLNATVKAYESSLYIHTSSHKYRNFCLWGIDRRNPRRENFLQIVGITQLAKLTTILLSDLAQNEREWQRFVQASMVMNAWQIHEIVSDNLAMGLADYGKQESPLNSLKASLLYKFNSAIALQINNFQNSQLELENFFSLNSGSISLFDQSLIPDEYKKLGKQYILQKKHITFNELDSLIWAPLTANIMSCYDVVQAVDLKELKTLVRHFLTLRYQAVNELLKSPTISLDRLLELSTSTILVIPTLAYYVAVLSEQSDLQSPLPIDCEELKDILSSAALIVRLLNDLGTPLITLDRERQKVFIERLKKWSKLFSTSEENFFDFILKNAENFPLLNRLHKDVLFGEINLAFYKINPSTSLGGAICQFEENLKVFSNLYFKKRLKLMKNLENICQNRGNWRIGILIGNFIHFHEVLYSNSYRTKEGEYAIFNA